MFSLICIIYQKVNFLINYSLWDFASNEFEKKNSKYLTGSYWCFYLTLSRDNMYSFIRIFSLHFRYKKENQSLKKRKVLSVPIWSKKLNWVKQNSLYTSAYIGRSLFKVWMFKRCSNRDLVGTQIYFILGTWYG